LIVVNGTLLSCLMAGASCTPKETGKPTILAARQQPFVVDIPVPQNFKLNERESTHTMLAGRRSVRHLYEGPDSTLLTRNFYAQHMPSNGWTLINERLLRNIYELKYRKGEELCEIRIEPKYSTFGGETTQVWATIKSDHEPIGSG
jgi:hypothetical protein